MTVTEASKPDYLTIAEVARELRVSERTVRKYRADGLLRTTRLPNARPLISRADLDTFKREWGHGENGDTA